MVGEIESVIRTVLDRRPQARFLVKYCRNALERGTEAKLSADLLERGVELISTEQPHSDYLRTIERSDIVFLPYEAIEYAGMASGVFAEGAALGKVMVVPGNTWLDRQVSDGRAAGVSFAPTNANETTAAVLRALDMLPALAKQAQERSGAFRVQHSSARNLELMLSLANEPHNMRPSYPLGSAIVFKDAVRSRGYMGGGWSVTGDHGVWTTGPSAELFFNVRPPPVGPLVVRVRLAPFIAKGHSQSIAISVNGVELSRWDFPDDGKRGSSWRQFTIPPHLAAQDEINILFRIRNPISPKQLGISADRRALGAYFHEIVIERADVSDAADLSSQA
jgi:hypothetical protein